VQRRGSFAWAGGAKGGVGGGFDFFPLFPFFEPFPGCLAWKLVVESVDIMVEDMMNDEEEGW
jgi:hypothetical protein